MSPSQPNSKRRILPIAVLLVLLLAAVGLIIYSSKQKDSLSEDRYNDPLSGETVSNPPGKGTDAFGAPESSPIFLGFSSFLNHGMTSEQLNALKEAFYNYSKTKQLTVKEVSIDVDSIVSKRQKSGSFYLLFNTRLDRKKDFKARVNYTGLSVVRLYLTDVATEKVVFDSGIIKPGLYSSESE